MRCKRLDGLLLHLGNALVTLALLFGGLEAFLSAHAYGYSRGELLAVCALASVLAVGLYAWRHGGWAVLGLLAVLTLARDPLWEKLLEPAADMFRSAGTRRAGLPLLILTAGVLALLLGWLVVRARCWYLCALVVTLPVLPPIMEGVLPEWTALLLSAAGWGTLLLTALLPRDRRLWRAQLFSLAGMGVFLALLTAALPREGYLRPDWATNARDKLVSAAAGGFSGVLDWDLQAGDLILDIGQTERPALRPVVSFGGGAGSAVERGRVDLLSAGPRAYSQRQIMTVETDQPDSAGTAFLFGGSSAFYTGESWEDAEPYAGASPDLLPASTAPGAPSAAMTISLRTGGGTLFTPYRLDQEPPASVGKQYTLSYRPGGPEDGFAPLEGPLSELAADYRSYVYANYLSVPAGIQTLLWPMLGAMERMPVEADPRLPEDYREAVAAALTTAHYLSGLAEYDLDAPAMEPGEDFVEHFLDARRGYCVHFATTGVLLLRMQNIPARYASGYLAHLDSSGRAAVLDSNAHAWAEIYLDGYGWYPVEMTPGGGTGSAAGQEEDGPGEDGQEAARPPQTAQSPQQPPQQTTQRPEAPPPDRSPAETPGGSGDAAPPRGDAETPREPLDLTWLWRTLEVLALPAALAGLYGLALARRRRSREDGDRNRSVIRAYGRYRRLTAWGCGEDALLEALARKARFSQHILTEEERAAAWERLEVLRRETAGALPAWKRWVLVLLRPAL